MAASPATNTEDDLAAWVARSRAEQGLPPTIDDPAVLARVVDVLRGGTR